jgi:hypothetical protein
MEAPESDGIHQYYLTMFSKEQHPKEQKRSSFISMTSILKGAEAVFLVN